MAGAAGVRPFASAAVMPQTETETYLWCRKVVESQFDSCQQQSRRTGISAPYVRFFGEDMHGITVFASLPGNPDTPSMAVSACEKNVIPRTCLDQIENGDSMPAKIVDKFFQHDSIRFYGDGLRAVPVFCAFTLRQPLRSALLRPLPQQSPPAPPRPFRRALPSPWAARARHSRGRRRRGWKG